MIVGLSDRCVPLTATHCRLRLTWSREHALWTPQQWSCVMFSDESKFSLQSDSRRTLIWRVPGTRYHQENTIERHRYGGAGWLVWRGIILGSRTNMHVQSVTMTGHIYRDVIVQQHVRLFWGAMGAEFLFMDDNARLYRANIVDECLQSEDITRMDWPEYSPDFNPIEHVWVCLANELQPVNPLPPVYQNFGGHFFDEWCRIPQDQIDNLMLSMPRRSRRLRMVREDTGAPNKGANCARMAADEVVGYMRAFLMLWRPSRRLLICGRSPEPGLHVNDISRIHCSQHLTRQSERRN
ncbi:transposable element Tc3 transposase [Trichonephila clavipes]|nr:transposable element Tc3 transposase [Trichonephila clavipes]